MIAGVVLAGGSATRMGGADKPLLVLGSRTILAEIIRRVAPQVGPICLSVRGDPARFASYGLPTVADADGDGPMAGVAAALGWAKTLDADALLVVPGDTPFLPSDLTARLTPSPAVATAGGRVHHLVCLLPVMIRPRLVAWLAQGHTRASEFLSLAGARHVPFPDPHAFHNINTPSDLDAARRRPDAGLP